MTDDGTGIMDGGVGATATIGARIAGAGVKRGGTTVGGTTAGTTAMVHRHGANSVATSLPNRIAVFCFACITAACVPRNYDITKQKVIDGGRI